MRARFRKIKENKDGFTLVELIVVLVILVILIGMLMPSLTGYIDKANEKAAMVECRQVVLAAQVETSDEYGKGLTSVDFGDYSGIREMAEVKGTINEIRAENGKVTYVRYTSKKGIVVIYENGEYRIEGKGDGSSSDDVPEKPDAGEVEGGGESGGGEVPSGNGVEVVDKEGNKYSIPPSGSWEELRAQLKAQGASGVTLSGCMTYQDETGFYIVSTWGPWVKGGDFESLEQFAGLNPGVLMKVPSGTIIYTDNNFGDAGAGDICYYQGSYYYAIANVGPNDIPGTGGNWKAL